MNDLGHAVKAVARITQKPLVKICALSEQVM